MASTRFPITVLSLMLLAMAALSLGGCGGSDSTPQWSVSIGPEGGTAMREDGRLVGFGVVIPPDALDTTIAVTIEETTPNPTPDATVVGLGAVYGPTATVFLEPIQLILPYDPTRVPSGTVAGDFVVKFRNRDGRIVTVVPDSVDEVNSVLRATVDVFASYWVAVAKDDGVLALSDYFPLNENDRYEYQNGIVLNITSSATQPNIQPESVRYIQLSGLSFVRDGMYFETDMGELLTTGRFSEQASNSSPSFQEIEDGALILLPAMAKLGDVVTSASTYVGYTPWTSLVSTYSGTSTVTVEILTEGRLDTPVGRFDDVLEVDITTERVDSEAGTTTITETFWLARDVGPVQIELPNQGGLGLLRAARVGGEVIVPE